MRFKYLFIFIVCICFLSSIVSADERFINGDFSNNLIGWSDGIELLDAGATIISNADDHYYNFTVISSNGAVGTGNISQTLDLTNVNNITYTFNLTISSSDAFGEFDLFIDDTSIATITENPAFYPIVETVDVSSYSGAHIVKFSFSGASNSVTDDTIMFTFDNASANGVSPVVPLVTPTQSSYTDRKMTTINAIITIGIVLTLIVTIISLVTAFINPKS